MKKNVIFLVCDGLSYDITVNTKKHKSPMTFLQKLRKESVDCTNMYSQAPYTEAGIMGLMYGRNPLDNGAYLYGMQGWENSTYKSFFDNGYQLYSSYFGSFTPPELMTKGGYIYSENYFTPFFSRYIRGKLDYYLPLFRDSKLSDEDYRILSKLLNRHFETMIMWHSEDAERNDWTKEFNPCIEIIEEQRQSISKWKENVEKEYTKFKDDPTKYVIDIFDNYSSHFITNCCDVDGLPLKDEIVQQRKWVSESYKPLFDKIRRKNRTYFLKNKQIPFKPLMTSLKKGRRQFLEHAYRTHQACNVFDISKMVSTELPQICSSARAFVRSFISWNENNNSSDPFFAYLHFDEFHRPLSFYSQDIADKDLVAKEMKCATDYVENLPKNYKGNIGFDLAAQYLDSCIEEMYMYLKEKDILDDTIFIVTADHGSSNYGGNVRFTVTNNFYPEQYHIPFICRGIGKEKTITHFTNIKDISYTVLSYCGCEIPSTFTGKSIHDGSGNTFVEYLGTGVPDLIRRPVFYQYRDSTCAFLLTGKIFEGSQSIRLLEYYDLENDPHQFNNIVNHLDSIKKQECITKWEKRIVELQDNASNWIMEDIHFGKEI